MALLLGDNSAANFTVTTSNYNAGNGEWFLDFVASATGSVQTLHLSISDPAACSNIKLAIRDNSGSLLAVAGGAVASSTVLVVSVPDVAVTEGETYYLGFLPDNGYPVPFQNSQQYSIQSDNLSTYSTPAQTIDIAAGTLATREVMIWAEGTAGPSLTVTDPITPGTTTTITTSGNVDPWTGARITDSAGNIKEITLASQTSVSASALGTQAYCLFGTVTLELYNDTESATTLATLNPPAAYEYLVELVASPSNLTNTGYLFNWSPDNGYEGVQVIAPFEIDNQGNIVLVPAGGTYTLYAIDDFDGQMQAFTVTIQDGVVVPSRMTRRNLTRRALTRRSLTARP